MPAPPGEFQTRCDYESVEPDELSFKKEQKVEVLEARMDGWWKVKCVYAQNPLHTFPRSVSVDGKLPTCYGLATGKLV